jgi:hypothetical protein
MSSLLRRIQETPARVRYFLALETYPPSEPEGAAGIDDPTLVFETYPGSILLENTVVAAYVPLTQHELLKDLGRQITIVNAAGQHIAKFREVQRVNGADTEGVGPATGGDGPFGTFFVKVWSADGQNVLVVRTG